MKVSKLKSSSRVDRSTYNLSQKIRLYGEGNTYPQDLRNLVNASRTAKSCVVTESKFVRGAGFTSEPLNKVKVGKRTTLFKLHGQIVEDYTRFNGFAVHVNYNGLLQEIGYSLVPFEHCRLEVDAEKNATGRIAVHPDWAKESGKPFKTSDIEYFNQYTADKNELKKIIIAEGGFDKFKGLIYYFSESCEAYPESPLDAIRELMAAQASADNIRVRNVKFNYLPAGILYKKSGRERANIDDDSADDDSEDGEFADSVEKWQGDENAAKILVVEQDLDDEDLKFVPFPQQNLDKFSENTDKTVDEGIRSFMGIPPELLGREGGRGFASETMQDAYNFYNSITDSERTSLEEAYSEVFGLLMAKVGAPEIKIQPLTYDYAKSDSAI